MNNQNNRQWSKSQSYFGTETSFHNQKTLAWFAISANRVFGPYYFEETVNQQNYLEMLKICFRPNVLSTAEYEKYNFQQYAIRLHTARTVQT